MSMLLTVLNSCLAVVNAIAENKSVVVTSSKIQVLILFMGSMLINLFKILSQYLLFWSN